MVQKNQQPEPKDNEHKNHTKSYILVITLIAAAIVFAILASRQILTPQEVELWGIVLGLIYSTTQVSDDSILGMLFAKTLFGGFQGKHEYLVVYTQGGKRWANWTKATLEMAGDTIALQWNKSSDFKQCMREWEGQKRRIISIVSPDYIEALPSGSPGFHEMKSKHGWKGRNTLVCVREDIYTHLDSIPGYRLKIVDFSKMDELQARDSLFAALLTKRQSRRAMQHMHAGLELGAPFPGKRSIWNIPKLGKDFTGRQEMLKTLYEKFLSGKTEIALQGLRGIGKTEIAKAYAQRNYDLYAAGLWLCLSDEKYEKSLWELALKLSPSLEEKAKKDIPGLRRVIVDWLAQNEDWLLILDDCQHLERVKAFIPTVVKGHILVTSPVNEMARLMHSEQVKRMEEEEGKDFLLRRAYPKDESEQLTEANRTTAGEIVNMLGGMPEALELAATCIHEAPCPLVEYPGLHRNQRPDLEEMLSRMVRDKDYARVIYAWYVCFEEVQKKTPGAALLLQHATFLDPDAIQWEIFEKLLEVSQSIAKKDTELNKIIWELLRFSLMERDKNLYAILRDKHKLQRFSLMERDKNVLTMNTHVQSILKGRIAANELPKMALHTLLAVSRVFPVVNINAMRDCREYAPHIESCEKNIRELNLKASDMADILEKDYHHLLEIAQLYDHYGCYLRDLASYEEAREFLDKGKELYEKFSNPLQVAISKSNIAELDYVMGNYQDAQLLYADVVQVREQELGADHLDTAAARHSLAILYDALGQSTDAEALYHAALATWEKKLATGTSLSAFEQISVLRKLGYTYRRLKRYPEAEQSYKKARDLCKSEKLVEERALCLANLARCYIDRRQEDKYDDALFHYKKATQVYKNILGEKHPQVAEMYYSQAEVYALQDDQENAQSYYQRALEIYQKKLPGHPRATDMQSKVDNFGGVKRKITSI